MNIIGKVNDKLSQIKLPTLRTENEVKVADNTFLWIGGILVIGLLFFNKK